MTRLKGEQLKGWGKELIFATTDKYCGKLMFFDKKGAKFSMHFHKDKDETWYVDKGEFLYRWIDTDTAEVPGVGWRGKVAQVRTTNAVTAGRPCQVVTLAFANPIPGI